MPLFQDMQTKRRAWTRAIEKAKSHHWKEFLDKAGEGHLWKAASCITFERWNRRGSRQQVQRQGIHGHILSQGGSPRSHRKPAAQRRNLMGAYHEGGGP